MHRQWLLLEKHDQHKQQEPWDRWWQWRFFIYLDSLQFACNWPTLFAMATTRTPGQSQQSIIWEREIFRDTKLQVKMLFISSNMIQDHHAYLTTWYHFPYNNAHLLEPDDQQVHIGFRHKQVPMLMMDQSTWHRYRNTMVDWKIAIFLSWRRHPACNEIVPMMMFHLLNPLYSSWDRLADEHWMQHTKYGWHGMLYFRALALLDHWRIWLAITPWQRSLLTSVWMQQQYWWLDLFKVCDMVITANQSNSCWSK